jgi:hypothetical protein
MVSPRHFAALACNSAWLLCAPAAERRTSNCRAAAWTWETDCHRTAAVRCLVHAPCSSFPLSSPSFSAVCRRRDTAAVPRCCRAAADTEGKKGQGCDERHKAPALVRSRSPCRPPSLFLSLSLSLSLWWTVCGDPAGLAAAARATDKRATQHTEGSSARCSDTKRRRR